MSILEDHKKIQDIAKDIVVSPPETAWDKIDSKLQQQAQFNKRRKLHFFKFWLSIAASVMVIIACASVIYFESQQPSKYSKGKVESWETLELEDHYLYTIDQARALDKIYNP